MEYAFIDDDGAWSDFYYHIRTCSAMLQLVVAGYFHTVSGKCARRQGWFIYEEPFVNSELRFD